MVAKLRKVHTQKLRKMHTQELSFVIPKYWIVLFTSITL